MPKPAFAAALIPVLLLAACGGREEAAAPNGAAEAEANGAAPANPSDPVAPAGTGVTVAPVVDPVQPTPPDAVSHPDGYLPPAPGEPKAANSSGPDAPATEDQHLRNGQ